MQKKLPVDVHSFEKIRGENYIYVDKTRHIYEMISEGTYFFLSRPRRFGKSLFVSTVKCFFEGKRDLFDGLWIAEQSDWNWQEHPVVLVDFSEISNTTPDSLQTALGIRLTQQSREYGIELNTPLMTSKFSELISELNRKTGMPIAVLIDEYDKPIIDHLGKGEEHLRIAEQNRDVLKQFFGVLKSLELAAILRFVFLTGISRFSKVSIFSELNNLIDISMDRPYADILGYTQEELEICFQEYLERFAHTQGWSLTRTLSELKNYYDGYRFSENETQMYNPFSILRALRAQELKAYWFETATPSFLINLLRQEAYELSEIEHLEMLKSMTTYNLENLAPDALLFQTGYVTIKEVRKHAYILGYPNQEVKQAFVDHIFYLHTPGIHRKSHSLIARLPELLQSDEYERFFETVQAIFASIPYDIQSKRDEAYYHTIFYLLMSASGMAAHSSVLTCDGRIDLAVEFAETIYIFEFKCNQSAETAIRQIQKNGYAVPYQAGGKSIMLVGVNFETETRNVTEWKTLPS